MKKKHVDFSTTRLAKNCHLKEIWENALKFQKTSEFQKMLASFKRQIENSITHLNQKNYSGTAGAIIFHKLKSSAKQLGLMELGEQAALLEEQIKDPKPEVNHQVNYKLKCRQAMNELDEWIRFTRKNKPKDE